MRIESTYEVGGPVRAGVTVDGDVLTEASLRAMADGYRGGVAGVDELRVEDGVLWARVRPLTETDLQTEFERIALSLEL